MNDARILEIHKEAVNDAAWGSPEESDPRERFWFDVNNALNAMRDVLEADAILGLLSRPTRGVLKMARHFLALDWDGPPNGDDNKPF